MKYYISWQDFLCRFNIWHRYTDWQSDTHTFKRNEIEGYEPVQMRFCFNCHWRQMKKTNVKSERVYHAK